MEGCPASLEEVRECVRNSPRKQRLRRGAERRVMRPTEEVGGYAKASTPDQPLSGAAFQGRVARGGAERPISAICVTNTVNGWSPP
jgi:hypothetical protein